MAITSDEPSGKKILCDNCDSEDAVQNRCNECAIFLCQYCTEFHKRSRSTRAHKVSTIEELKSTIGAQKVAKKVRCSKHKEEVIKLFCKTCQTTICRDCTIVDHQGHKYGFVEDVADEEKQKIQNNLSEVKDRKGRVVQGIVNLKKFSESLEAKKNSTISEINQHFHELVKILELRKTEMVQKAVSITNTKQKQVQAQLEILEVALASCESSIEFTEQAFKNGNDTQILSMEKYILQSLEQLKTANDLTEPCVTENMIFFIPSSVQDKKEGLFIDYDVNVSVANPENCRASFQQGGKVFHVGKQYSIKLICSDENKRRLRGQVIKPLFTGVVVSDVVVNDNKDGSYIISFCPRQDGQVVFDVSINGLVAPRCSLTKKISWVLSDVHGNGVISDNGCKMSGQDIHGMYCWTVGSCYFSSGVHSWTIRLINGLVDHRKVIPRTRLPRGFRKWDRWASYDEEAEVIDDIPYQNDDNLTSSAGTDSCVEVGIIDCEELRAVIAPSKKKWVCRQSVEDEYQEMVLTLDMERKEFIIQFRSTDRRRRVRGERLNNIHQITSNRVLPFFACNSPHLSIFLLER